MKIPKFQERGNYTYEETLGPTQYVETEEEAREYFENLVNYIQRVAPDMPREEAERVQRINIGYYSGYFDRETMQRVQRLFKVSHPIFGDDFPSLEDAFEAGRNWAEGEKRP
jgi:hypothetical protein